MQGRSRVASVALVLATCVAASVTSSPNVHASTLSAANFRSAAIATVDDGEMALSLSQDMNISYSDALEALHESGTVIDFQLKNRPDPRFGATWVTYEAGYTVHVRVTGSSPNSMASEIAAYENLLGHKVVVHTGGASATDLWNFAEEVATQHLNVVYDLYDTTGVIQLFPDTNIDQIPKFFPREYLQDSPMPLPVHEAMAGYSGEDLLTSNGTYYASTCTAGFMWGTYATSGLVTAGHCYNASAAYNSWLGGTWYTNYTFSESCPGLGGDFQAETFTTFNNPGEYFTWKSTNPPTYIPVYDIAGGYYVGQPVAKVGNWANPSRTSTGVVNNPAIISDMVPAGGDCTGGITNSLLDTTVASNHGDSGGPMLLSYGGQWYGAAITHSGYTGGSAGEWLGFMPSPGSWFASAHYCTFVNPCGPID